MDDMSFINKLNDFKKETDDASSKECIEAILLRLKRILTQQGYSENDPFVKVCRVRWGISPKSFANLSNAFGEYYYVSDEEEEKFHKNELEERKNDIRKSIDEIIEVIKKDGVPQNMHSIQVSQSTGFAISMGNSGNTQIEINNEISDFNKHYAQALNDIVSTSLLDQKEKEGLTDALKEYKESLDNGQAPSKTLLRYLAGWSATAIHIGGSLAAIYEVLEKLF